MEEKTIKELEAEGYTVRVTRAGKVKPSKRIIEMIKMRMEGESYEIIGYRFGLTRARIHQLISPRALKKYDLTGTEVESLQGRG